MPDIKEAVEKGKGGSPLHTAYFVEHVLAGELDDYAGKVFYVVKLEELLEQKNKRCKTEWGYVRLVNDELIENLKVF